jgi:microcystin-dependent protein
MNPYLAQCSLVAFNFAPTGYQIAAGQTLSISSNAALFALLGTNFGGNGTSTFQLPNLQGRVALSQDTGGQYVIGQAAGETAVTLLSQQTPTHVHGVLTAGRASQPTPGGNSIGDAATNLYASGSANAAMSPAAVPVFQGGSQPHNNMMPFLALNWIIAVNGVFPPRS